MIVASTFSAKRADTPTCSLFFSSDLVVAIHISTLSLNMEEGTGANSCLSTSDKSIVRDCCSPSTRE
jgi:hypothetical protein